MICIKVPKYFRPGDFNELLEMLQTYTESGYTCQYEGNTCVIKGFIGTGWKIRLAMQEQTDRFLPEWFIMFDNESLASIFTLRWPQ